MYVCMCVCIYTNRNPSAQRAQPEYEFKRVINTGVSAAPMYVCMYICMCMYVNKVYKPIEAVKVAPSIVDNAATTYMTFKSLIPKRNQAFSWDKTDVTDKPVIAENKRKFKNFPKRLFPLPDEGRLPLSLPYATSEPK